MFGLSRRSVPALIAALAVALVSATASAQDKPRLRVSSLTLPVFNPIVWNIMKERGFDAKNGFELEIRPYPSISAFYAAFATGETDVLVGGPTILQKLYLEGVPVRIIATGLTLSDLVVFVRDPSIKSLADLKGKQMAADMGGSQYQMVAIYAGAKGLKLGREITIVNGNFAVSRAQLEAGRVDAAVIAEPMATSIMLQNPDWKVIFNGAEGWKELTGQDGWEIVTAMRADAIQRVPLAPKMMIAALQDVAGFIRTETDAADKLANETVKLPAGVLKSAVTGKRWDFDVRPAWGPDRKAIWDMMERAVQAGFYEKMPDEKIIYVP
ncbi:MAG: ABC transporter substrate-binding protein [Xanthobacteraceae bacterium]|jgi:NitT/TauT family transport system substrate-binding protein